MVERNCRALELWPCSVGGALEVDREEVAERSDCFPASDRGWGWGGADGGVWEGVAGGGVAESKDSEWGKCFCLEVEVVDGTIAQFAVAKHSGMVAVVCIGARVRQQQPAE